jgi:hypothetical protein
MFTMLFWLALVATIVLGVSSKRRWEDYHRGSVTRVELTNRIVAALLAGAATVGLLIGKSVLHLP